jgi:chaperonin GroEL
MSVVKEVLTGPEARASIIAGLIKTADTVGKTLGPSGLCVILEQSYGNPKITKDGVTVAKEIVLANKFENLGAALLKEVAIKSNDKAGDGTTTTSVLASAIVKETHKKVVAGFNPMDIKRGVEAATKLVVETLQKSSYSIESSTQIAQIATISANGDSAIGNMLAEAFEKVGKDGVVTVEEAKSNSDLELEVVEGLNFDRGYLSPYFVTNSEKMICEFEKPYILIYDKKISSIQQMLPLLEAVVQSGRPLFIIAEDIEGEALATLVVNKLRGGLKIAAVKAPGFGDRRKSMLEDIAIVTGGHFISEDIGNKLENVTLAHLGTAQRIIATKDDTTIVGGAGDKLDIQNRCSQIRKQIEDTSSDYDREKLQERLAKLSGGVAVVKVGAQTEVELKERKDRVEDAYHATKAAIEEGITIGGGCALLYAAKTLGDFKGANPDENAGIEAVKMALSEPCRRILENAGIAGASVIEKLLEKNDLEQIYDARNHSYVNAFQAGIIDPTKVVRTALESAASIASLLVTTEAAIVIKPQPKAPGSAPNPMGGMEDMDY